MQSWADDLDALGENKKDVCAQFWKATVKENIRLGRYLEKGGHIQFGATHPFSRRKMNRTSSVSIKPRAASSIGIARWIAGWPSLVGTINSLERLFTQRALALSPQRRLRIAIAQPFNLGDVVACLPMAGLIKRDFPQADIVFICRAYAKPLLDVCEHVDGFLDADEVSAHPRRLMGAQIDILFNPFPCYKIAAAAHEARVPVRIGNLRRTRMYRHCNRFVLYRRRNSPLHEAQIIIRNLAGIGLPTQHDLPTLVRMTGLTRKPQLCADWAQRLATGTFNLIIHPKSNGNGREWPPEYYLALARSLPSDRFTIFMTGTASERAALRTQCPELFQLPNLRDVMGSMTLSQLIAFIGRADGMLASGTGPLHIAAALGIPTLGLFPPRRGMQASRWQPIGEHAAYLSRRGVCSPGPRSCPRDTDGGACACMMAITPALVLQHILAWDRRRTGGAMQSR